MRENIRQEIDLFNLHLRVIENFTELMKTRDRFKKTKKENVRYKVESYYTIELFVGFVEIFKSHCSEMSGFFFFFFFCQCNNSWLGWFEFIRENIFKNTSVMLKVVRIIQQEFDELSSRSRLLNILSNFTWYGQELHRNLMKRWISPWTLASGTKFEQSKFKCKFKADEDKTVRCTKWTRRDRSWHE